MSNYPLFSVIGIEIEYMLVDTKNLNVQAKADVILQALAGKLVNEVALGDIAVSNELVMHVLELKTNGPAKPDAPLANRFYQALLKIQTLLDQHGLQLVPSSAHPWMDPHRETKRWPHDNHEIYQQYDKIFDCRGHGWSNLQCMHINLPFANDEEFKQLHNSIRLLLPLLPGLAASSPILDGRFSGLLDTRLRYYADNQKKIPEITGEVVPDFIATPEEYQDKILRPMYEAIRPYDPEGILQHEWLNSRAAIPKFGLSAIEIRILDTQENVEADIAIAKAIFALLKKWNETPEVFLDKPCSTKLLKTVYDQSCIQGLASPVGDKTLQDQWQLRRPAQTCRDAWHDLIEQISDALDYQSQRSLEIILNRGNLSERIVQACQHNYDRAILQSLYRQLSDCLLENKAFLP